MVSNEKEAVFPAAIRNLCVTASQALVGGPWYVTILTSHGTDGVVLLIYRAPGSLLLARTHRDKSTGIQNRNQLVPVHFATHNTT